ncbi:MAG TPA: hypothetical protein DCY40_03025 [Actinobacteria bacterium]|nr:hypothetical protein [Actinomycetota bacterium]
MSSRNRWLVVLLLGVVVAGACGDDDAATTTVATTGTTTAATTAPPAPTELRFTFEGVTGVQDKILVATVFLTGDQSVAGTVCVPVTADPFSGSGVVATAAPDNPCSYDAPYGVLLTAEGAYSYVIAAFTPGTQTASACASGEVTVAGPSEVVIAAADLRAANCTS